jgi:hypothetical protein
MWRWNPEFSLGYSRTKIITRKCMLAPPKPMHWIAHLSSTYLSAAGKVSPSKTMQHIHVMDSFSTHGQHLPPRLDNTWTALCSTWQRGQQQHSAATAARSALGQQHLQHTSTPDSNLQHSAAPAAPMDSSSCTSSNSQRPAPNCPRQGQHTQQTHTRTSRFFLFLVSC